MRAQQETAHQRGQRLDQYFTRPALAKAVVEWAELKPGQKVLEPSCGAGNLVRWMPDDCQVTAMDIDQQVLNAWPEEMLRLNVDQVGGDFLKTRLPSDAFDVVVMNPPYGYVGSGAGRKAADRVHVQHALRMAPNVIVLARANFLWGQERYQHIFRYAQLVRMAVLTHRPSYWGPALLPGQDAARHDFGVFHLRRGGDRDSPVKRKFNARTHDCAWVSFWTQDWRDAA